MRNLLLAFCILFATSSYVAAESRQIDFDRYGQSPAVMAAIVSGLASVSPCSGPIRYWEDREGDRVILNIQCNGNEDDEANAIITFRDYGEFLLVESFEFAG